MGGRIFHRTGLAFCCRSRLSSNVRHHKTKIVATRAARAAQSAESQAANAQLHRERATVLGPSARSRQITSEALIRLTKNQMKYEANRVSASREVPVAWQASDFNRRFAGIGCGFTGPVGQSVRRSAAIHTQWLRWALATAAGKLVAGQLGQRGAASLRAASPKSPKQVAHSGSCRYHIE